MTTSEVAAASLEPQVKALLDTIAFAEGTSGGNGYRMMYTGKLFSDFSDHPRINNCGTFKNGKSVCSTAAGRYQFLASTWDSAAETLSLQDFSNKSQDLAAVYLIQKRGGLEPILKGQFEEAANAIRQEWASFPGAGYGQPEVELAKLKATYEERLAYYQNS
ncbi:glycoside hydrolase family 104 protein [Candidatus Woesearchaeota archaeon]|nr:glycoside hydrolase family 104 protein [Candidatus Woesearchaeota archaeon]MCF7901308.1 glycoside hydrolase family 104 protein [Candidatus Woesearchaeota archaeon]MCF8013786.1 glycoside hydrolase family 104 protein [Candidatus Woesearchaeota archaeon]